MNLFFLSDPDSFGFLSSDYRVIDVFLSSELHSYERLIWLYFSFSFIKSFYILEHSSWVFSHIISAIRKILIVDIMQVLTVFGKMNQNKQNRKQSLPL